MNNYFLIAGILCFILGVVHSVLGELLIFKRKRNQGSLVPSQKSAALKVKHLRIIWATWHVVSGFGWCIGAILIKISFTQNELSPGFVGLIIQATSYTMFAAALLVLLATKGKHPGWIVLLLIGILLFIGN